MFKAYFVYSNYFSTKHNEYIVQVTHTLLNNVNNKIVAVLTPVLYTDFLYRFTNRSIAPSLISKLEKHGRLIKL